MEIVLLGTGGADGWPNPWCACASCTAMRRRGDVRGHTAALVDDVLLLDCGPDVARSALRHGRTLAHVRHLLVTHSHQDHCEPAALLWRSWATTASEPLDLVAPPAALAVMRSQTASPPVQPHEVYAGDHVDLAGYTVRVLAARHGGPELGPAVLYDVTGPDGARLLWATDTASLPESTLRAVEGAAYDVVLLEEAFGDRPVAGQDHHGLADWPLTIAELRRRGAVVAGTRCVAVHLGHGNPPPPQLDRRFALWGGEAPPDGTVLTVGPVATAAEREVVTPRRVVVLGGARSGKSAEAERRLLAEPSVTYVATGAGRGDDPDWQARVASHRARRPAGWTTVETVEVAPVLRQTREPVLVDDLGLWVTAALDAAGWTADAVADRCAELVSAWRDCPGRAVLVAPEVGCGVVPEHRSGRVFRDVLGRLTADLAAESDEVWRVTAGIPERLR